MNQQEFNKMLSNVKDAPISRNNITDVDHPSHKRFVYNLENVHQPLLEHTEVIGHANFVKMVKDAKWQRHLNLCIEHSDWIERVMSFESYPFTEKYQNNT